MKNVLKPLVKCVLIPLGLTAAASASDAAIHKKVFGSDTTILIISNEEMNDIMKIIKTLEGSGLLIKDVKETIKNEAKGQKRGFLSMLLGTLDASLLGNLLTGKGTEQEKAHLEQASIFNAPHPLPNFEIQKYYQMNLNLMVFMQEINYLK